MSDTNTKPSVWISCIDLFAGFLLFAALSSLTVEVHLRFNVMSTWLFDRCEVTTQLPEAPSLHASVQNYFFHNADIPSDSFTEKELNHFQDVKSLLKTNRIFGVLCGLGALLLLCSSRCWRRLRMAFGWMAGIAMALALLSTQWLMMFRSLHPLFFAGDSWDFNDSVHVIVWLYPEKYIIGKALAIIATVLTGGIVFRILAWLKEAPQEAIESMSWSRSNTVMVFVSGMSMPVMWILGRAFYTRSDPAAYLYYAIVIAVLVSSTWVWNAGRKILPMTFLCCSLLFLTGLGAGVRSSYIVALQSTQQGEEILQGIESYIAEKNELPEQLLDLQPDYIDKLPELEVGYGSWQFLTEGQYYLLWFKGPLEAVFEYPSTEHNWHLPPLPIGLHLPEKK